MKIVEASFLLAAVLSASALAQNTSAMPRTTGQQDSTSVGKSQTVTWEHSCPSATYAWGSGCSGTVPATGDGQSSTGSNSVSGYNGSVQLHCSAGSWSTVSSSCNAVPSPCSNQVVSWTDAADTSSSCSGSTGSGVEGDSTTVTYNSSGSTGSANYTCSGGSWQGPTNSASCTSKNFNGGGNCWNGPAPPCATATIGRCYCP